jgi:hypothetical protein
MGLQATGYSKEKYHFKGPSGTLGGPLLTEEVYERQEEIVSLKCRVVHAGTMVSVMSSPGIGGARAGEDRICDPGLPKWQYINTVPATTSPPLPEAELRGRRRGHHVISTEEGDGPHMYIV